MGDEFVEIPIKEEQDVVIARLKGKKMAEELGMKKVDQVRIATAISELARNILLYAGTGVVQIKKIHGEKKGIEVVAIDHGPGIENIELALTDGYSTSGALGVGLPGTKRLMDEFEIWSEKGKGTIVTVRKWA